MARRIHIVSEVAEVLGMSRSDAHALFTEGVIAVVWLPGRRKPVAGAHLDRPLGMTNPATDPAITTTDRLNPTPDSHASPTQATPKKPRTRQERATLTENTRPPISTAGTCHPFGVALRDVAVPAC